MDSGKADGKGLKERLEREKMLRLQEAEQYMAPRQDLVNKQRAQEELIVHTKLDVMQLVRTQHRKSDETDEEVRLVEWSNDREAMRATGQRRNPLYIAGSGRGRFMVETMAMWDD